MRDDDSRPFDTDFIRDISWGTHFCQFYQTKKDLIDLLTPYFKAGLENNELCIWLIPEFLSVKEAKEALKKEIPDYDIYLEKGQIEFIPYSDWFLKEGAFDSQKVVDVWVEKLNQALNRGYNGLRATEDACWMEEESWNNFFNYEEKLDSFVNEHRIIVLCTYCHDTCNIIETIDVISNHQMSLVKRKGKWVQIGYFKRKNTVDSRLTEDTIWESKSRRKVTEAIEFERQRFFDVLDRLPAMICLLTSDHRVAFANRSFREKFGESDDRHCYEYFFGSTRPCEFCEAYKVLETGQPHRWEITTPDGSIINVYNVPLTDIDNSPMILEMSVDVTEYKKAEEALCASEARYRFLYESSLDGIMLTKSDGTILSANSQACNLFNMTEDEIIRAWGEGIVIKDERLTAMLEERELTGRAMAELTFKRKDGSTFVGETSSSLFKDTDGSIKYSITIRDITERKRAEEALRDSEARFKAYLENSAVIAWMKDEEGRHTFLSSNCEKRFGVRFEDWNGKTDFDLWPPEIARKFRENDLAVLKGGKNVEVIEEARNSDGSTSWWLNNKFLFVDSPGKKYVGGLGVDITERKQAEENLRLSEERYRSFIQNSQGIAFQIDKNFNLEFIHGAVEEITGYSEEELLLDTSWKQLVVPEDIDTFLKAEQKAAKSPGDYSGDIEYRIRTKDGNIKWMHEFHQKISGKNGKPEKYTGVIYDITENKEIEEALEKIETARQKELHHRIKNNLQVISSLLDLTAEKFKNKECIKDSEVLKAFRESQDRVMSIALIHKELYEGVGDGTLNFSLYLRRLVDNLFQTYRIGDTDINLNMDFEENVFFDMDVAIPLGMIVNELVSNSFKYAFSDMNKGTIQIKLLCERAGDELRNKEEEFTEKGTKYSLIVSDDGAGIPDTVDLENPDTLGLQLVYILVHQLNGEIELKREKGTEFIIHFSAEEKGN